MKCPLCDSKVTYIGFVSVECSGRGCENYKKQVYNHKPIDLGGAVDLLWLTHLSNVLRDRDVKFDVVCPPGDWMRLFWTNASGVQQDFWLNAFDALSMPRKAFLEHMSDYPGLEILEEYL